MTKVSISHFIIIFSSQQINLSWSPPPHQDPACLPYLWNPEPLLHRAQEITKTWQTPRKDILLTVSTKGTPEGFPESQPNALPCYATLFPLNVSIFPKKGKQRKLLDCNTTYGESRDRSKNCFDFSLKMISYCHIYLTQLTQQDFQILQNNLITKQRIEKNKE